MTSAIHPIHDKDGQSAKNKGELNERHLWKSVGLRALRQVDLALMMLKNILREGDICPQRQEGAKIRQRELEVSECVVLYEINEKNTS